MSGIGDPDLQKRINDALVAPLNEWTFYVRSGLTGPEPDGGIPHVHNEVRVDRETTKVLSVRYLLTVDSTQFGNHGAGTSKLVNIGLATGTQPSAADVFRDIADSRSPTSALEQRIPAHAPDGYCNGEPPVDGERGLEPQDARFDGVFGGPVLQMTFDRDGVHFTIDASALGYAMACDGQEFEVPYQERSDLMTPPDWPCFRAADRRIDRPQWTVVLIAPFGGTKIF
jgi:eukaryotic-like serine/threonine-protein kinase